MTVGITLAVSLVGAALMVPRLAVDSLRDGEGDTGEAPEMGSRSPRTGRRTSTRSNTATTACTDSTR